MDTTEIAKLRNAVRQHVSASREQRFCYRALCVLLIAEGHRPNQVAEWLGEHTRTLERWRKRYTDNGLDGLIDETSPGRPPKLSHEEWQRLQQELAEPPTAFGLDGKRWQGKLLQSHLSEHYDVDFSLRQCQRLLKQARQRPAKVAYKSGNGPCCTPAANRIASE
ncbi:MAG: helix-turn-helix domain-containing protein [Gammaproteobacteria bacterium]|nr:helix-turn-helix domain-containing protein [Gammaproteobacteria bacterium]